MAADSALSYRDHSVSFGRSVITHGVTFDLVPGRILALVGESGSGKSVTALAALGLAGNARQTGSVLLAAEGAGSASKGDSGTADGGGVDLVGLDAAGLRSVRGADIGVVFQEPMSAFNPMFRIGHQIAEAVHAHHDKAGSREGSGVSDRVRAQLVKVGLDEPDRVMRAYPHELSGGQLQRAMIALATVNSPRVLIADEPTTALDVTVQTGILDLLRSQATEEGQAVLLITHDMGVVADIADDVAVMKDGRIVETGEVHSLFSSPQDEYTQQLLAAVPRLGARVGTGAETSADARSETPADAQSGAGAPPAAGSGNATRSVSAIAAATAPLAAELRAASVVHKTPAGPFTAIEDIDLQIPAGTITGLVGESGSGKSTIAAVLTGGQKLTSGEVFVDGHAVTTRPNRHQRKRRADIGVVFQDPRGSLNPRRSVGAQIAEPLRVHSRLDHTQIRTRVAGLLDDVQLPNDFAQRYPHELSGGQRQRVAIARALALEPKLLIADEPTSALDVSVQRGVLRLLAELHEAHEFACLFISHDLAVIEQLATTVVVLRHGRIVEQGTSAQVLTDPRQDYTRELIDSAPLPDPEIQAARRAARLAA
jgi:peptide/nickel transport system ATP-binding protein